MEHQNHQPEAAAELRRQAEAIAQEKTAPVPEDLASLSAESTRQRFHELQVHQIELELQNEELRRTQVELAAAQARYFDLYDLAPVGYVTLSEQGLILEANLTAETLLGVARSRLVKQPISRFLLPEDEGLYYWHRQQLLETGAPRGWEMGMRSLNDAPFWAQVQITAAQDADGGPVCRVAFSDITEHKTVQETLTKYHLHANHTRDIILFIRIFDGRILEANAAAVRVYGYQRQELLSLSIQDLQAAADDGKIAAQMAQASAAGLLFETIHRCKNGTHFPVEVNSTGTKLGPERILVSVIRDITERKQAERFRTVADFAYDWEYWLTPDGTLPYVSSSCEHLTGYRAEEFQQDPELLLRIVHPDDRDRVAGHDVLVPEGECHQLDFRILTRGGEERWIAHASQPVQDDDGKCLGQRVSNRDITDRKRAEEALENIAARLTLAVRAGGVGIWDWDVLHDHLIWDNQMFQLYGITADQFSSAYAAWQAGLHPEDAQRGDEEIQRALRGEKEFDTEFRVRWPDGTIHYIRALALVQRNAVGQPTQMIGTNWDITNGKQAEEQLREVNRQLEAATTRAQELSVQAQAANAAKSRFLATMSHEIRTPLNAVLGFAQLLQRDPKLSLDHQPWVATINRSGEHLLALLNEILELSKIEAGQQTLIPSAFDLPALLRELETLFQPQADTKQLTLRLDGLDDVERYVVADKRRLLQILMNLLGNAVKFTATGGVWVRVSTEPQGTEGLRLVVLVGDSGPSIGAEEIGQLFAAFEQATAGRHSGSGTGLGLAISRQLARLMGGDLTVTSAVGQGSVFRLEVLVQPTTESLVATELKGSPVQSGLSDVSTQAAHAAEPARTTVERPPARTRELLDSLPAELRKQLHEAAQCGRQGQLRQTLQQVADPELRRQLQILVAKFDYEPFLLLP